MERKLTWRLGYSRTTKETQASSIFPLMYEISTPPINRSEPRFHFISKWMIKMTWVKDGKRQMWQKNPQSLIDMPTNKVSFKLLQYMQLSKCEKFTSCLSSRQSLSFISSWISAQRCLTTTADLSMRNYFLKIFRCANGWTYLLTHQSWCLDLHAQIEYWNYHQLRVKRRKRYVPFRSKHSIYYTNLKHSNAITNKIRA